MKTLEFIVKEIPESQLEHHEIFVSATEIGLEIEEAKFIDEIHGHLELSRNLQDVYVKGDFTASIEVECRRCADSFLTGVEAEIALQFYPTDQSTPADPLLADTGERYYLGTTIDVSDEVRQALTLEMPFWSLCSESCKGLCPHCGENLNVADCDCHVPEVRSSPFTALADLLHQPEPIVTNGSQTYQERET